MATSELEDSVEAARWKEVGGWEAWETLQNSSRD
jgi:hypothetical protein